MNQLKLVKLAKKKGYDKFHPKYFENSKILDSTWFLEMCLLQQWLLTYDIIVTVDIQIQNEYVFKACHIGQDVWSDKTYKSLDKALYKGLKQGLKLINYEI